MTNQWGADFDRAALIYLDNAATTFPKPEVVYEQADRFYRLAGGNAGRGGNPLARQGSRLLAEVRALLAAWLEAPSSDHVIFTASATEALNLAILGTALHPGDYVYVSPFEHNSVLRPLEYLRATRAIELRQIPFARRTFACQLDRLEAAFKVEPPTLVCVTQASNVCGLMPPVRQIAQLAKASHPQAVVVVDGAQTAGLYPLALDEGLIDALIFSGHKSLYGPYGIAGLVLGSAWRPRPLLYGGTGTRSESVEMPTTLPTAYEAGSHNLWALAGLQAALHWLQAVGRATVVEHTLQLAETLCESLRQLPGCDLYIPARTEWCGIVSFTLDDARPQAIESALGAQQIAVRAGLHCAPWTHEWLGTRAHGGSVRASAGYFNERSEVARLIACVQSL